MTPRRRVRAGFLALASGLVAAPAAGQAGPGEPVHVFYDARACDAPDSLLELQVWDRDGASWRPHPRHARIEPDTCQLEDPGYLLNELRYRCIDPRGASPPGAWIVGARVFDPGVVGGCGAAPRTLVGDAPGVRITSPRPGSVVREPSQRVRIEGAVQLGGRDARGWDVLVAIDTSESAGRSLDPGGPSLLRLETGAAGALLEALQGRPDRVRVGVLAYSSAQSRAGARVLVAPTADLGRARRALARLAASDAAGEPRLGAAVDVAVAALAPADALAAVASGGRQALLVLADGRPPRPFGGAARLDSDYRGRLEQSISRASRAGVAVHVFPLGGPGGAAADFLRPDLEQGGGGLLRAATASQVAALPLAQALPHVQQVVLENASVAVTQVATLRPDGRFQATLPLRSGDNRVVATAQSSDGREARVAVDLHFDDTQVKQRLLEAEREHIERIRERQRKQLELRGEASRSGASASEARKD
jgi:von Willebrand factor type A domain